MSSLLLNLAAAALSLAPAQDSFAIRAGHLDMGDGRLVAGGTVLVQGGKIVAAGTDVKVPEGTSVIDHDGVVSPGLVAGHSYDGAAGENHDPTRSVLDGARIADAFAPGHGDFERALAAGITSVVLAPSPPTLVGGRAAVAKTHGGGFLEDEAHLVVSLSSAALVLNRYPTSYQGALAELGQRFTDGQGPFAAAASGKLPVLIHVDSRDDVKRASALAARHGLKGALLGAPANLGAQVTDIKQSGLGVVLGPYPVGTNPASLRSAVELGEQRVPLAFGLDAPWNHPEALRMGAALCVRAGLAPEIARKALTGGAAGLAGVSQRIGKLAAGLDADLVLWSGDPLDLTSSVEAVYIDGHLVHHGGGQ